MWLPEIYFESLKVLEQTGSSRKKGALCFTIDLLAPQRALPQLPLIRPALSISQNQALAPRLKR
jgi:hypothetical protein